MVLQKMSSRMMTPRVDVYLTTLGWEITDELCFLESMMCQETAIGRTLQSEQDEVLMQGTQDSKSLKVCPQTQLTIP